MGIFINNCILSKLLQSSYSNLPADEYIRKKHNNWNLYYVYLLLFCVDYKKKYLEILNHS